MPALPPRQTAASAPSSSPSRAASSKSMHTENSGFTYLFRGRRAELHCRAERDRGRHVPPLLHRDERLRGCLRERPRHPASPRLCATRRKQRCCSLPAKQTMRWIFPKAKSCKKHMPYIGTHEQMPGEAAIRDILAKMGKTAPEQELNCGSCGYATCREKAIAVYQGQGGPYHVPAFFEGARRDLLRLCYQQHAKRHFCDGRGAVRAADKPRGLRAVQFEAAGRYSFVPGGAHSEPGRLYGGHGHGHPGKG